jgi:hypothetical protein
MDVKQALLNDWSIDGAALDPTSVLLLMKSKGQREFAKNGKNVKVDIPESYKDFHKLTSFQLGKVSEYWMSVDNATRLTWLQEIKSTSQAVAATLFLHHILPEQ